MQTTTDPEMTKDPGASPSPSAQLRSQTQETAQDVTDDTPSSDNRKFEVFAGPDVTRIVRERIAHVRGHQMTSRARNLLVVLLDICDGLNDKLCSPSVPELAAELRASDRTVQRALRDLEINGWIVTTLRPIGPKSNDTNVYELLPNGRLLNRARSSRPNRTHKKGSWVTEAPGEEPEGVTASPPINLQSVAVPVISCDSGYLLASHVAACAGVVAYPAGKRRGAPSPAERTRLSKFAERVREAMAREDAEAERVLDMIGIPSTKADASASSGEAAVDEDPEEPSTSDDGSTVPASATTPAAEPEQEGGTPEGGAVAPSEIDNLTGDRSRARADVSLSKPRAAVVARLLSAGLGELARGGYEERLLRIAEREGVGVFRVIEAVGSVCRRREEDIAAGGEKGARWSKSTWEIRPYLYRSVQNEVREQKEERARARELAERRRRQMLLPMEEKSLGKVGGEILAELRKQDVLAPAATVELAHRLAGRCSDGVAGGRLSMEDILHTIRECAENERDKVAVGQGRPPGQLANALRWAVDKAQPGCAKRAQSGSRSAHGGGQGNRGAGRGYEPQAGGTVEETWEW